MQVNLQGKNLELTEAIKSYIIKKVNNLEKVLASMEGKEGEAKINFEVSRTTNHHKSGDIFHADCSVKISGLQFYAKSDTEDLYAAIDQVTESLFNDISRDKDRRQTLFKRGAMSIKKMLKGLSRRNPFTSKY